MIRVFLIEDEAPARERLAALIADTPPCAVAGTADSVATAKQWLRVNPAPDLICADVQLGDGLSLELFSAAPAPCPVIFTTAHDQYLLEAFATQGIAYLLKPVKSAALAAAVRKYQEFGRHFTGVLGATNTLLNPPRRRQRLLAKRGTSFQPVALTDIAYFFSENKLTFLVTRTGEKCLMDEPLTALADELDPAQFFRVNRNFLVQATAVKSFASVGRGRLLVQLLPRPAGDVPISQETAGAFRTWAGQ